MQVDDEAALAGEAEAPVCVRARDDEVIEFPRKHARTFEELRHWVDELGRDEPYKSGLFSGDAVARLKSVCVDGHVADSTTAEQLAKIIECATGLGGKSDGAALKAVCSALHTRFLEGKTAAELRAALLQTSETDLSPEMEAEVRHEPDGTTIVGSVVPSSGQEKSVPAHDSHTRSGDM